MSEVRTTIESAVPASVTDEVAHAGETTVEIAPGRLLEVARFVKGPPLSFLLLSDVSCADIPEDPRRFRVAYHLFSLESGSRLRLRAWADPGDDDTPELDSVTSVWATANWHEREVYDMFGVRFRNHPDLARILMPLDWEGHPLRRDYPLGGEEVQFTDAV
ncbi:MAG: NADH-quinone oxidoreductase subunit C [Thermoleophilia bacterium]